MLYPNNSLLQERPHLHSQKKDYKFRIPGTVIDKSSAGATLFVEPVSVAKYGEELQLLKLDEENEVRRILYTLTALIAEQQELFYENIR